MELLKVGELARRTGLSVRTLHHYEKVGLLPPAHRTPTGHRLYGEDHVRQLHKILALKQLGMSLEEMRGWLSSEHFGALEALRMQRTRVSGQIEMLKSVQRRLEMIEQRVSTSDRISIDDILQALEAMAMFEKYYTKEQLEQLEQRRVQIGEETIKAVEKEWPELIAKVRSAIERGVDPKSEEVRALGRRWRELVEMFTGGDPGITASLSNMYQNEPSMRDRAGIGNATYRYVRESWSAD
jgi:DNA-binding transcriptional MerR regulator